jgi:hypothetical protein
VDSRRAAEPIDLDSEAAQAGDGRRDILAVGQAVNAALSLRQCCQHQGPVCN